MTPPREQRIVCKCLRVSEEEIRGAILRHGLCSVEEVTRCTEAGDGCLSCHPALREILREERNLFTSVPNRSARRDSSAVRPL